MLNITKKLIRLRGCAITLPTPAISAGARKNVLPKPIRNWLTIICCGRVRLLEYASISAPAQMQASAIDRRQRASAPASRSTR